MRFSKDVESVHRLELLCPLFPSKVRQTCLFGLLNNCSTTVGRRQIRAKILQPNLELTVIQAYQECIAELEAKPMLLNAMNEALQQFHSVDRLSQLAYRVRKVYYMF